MAIESLESLRDHLRVFAKDREWDQYHTPKNLSMALIAEAAELIEHISVGRRGSESSAGG